MPGIGLLPEFVWVVAETAVRGAPPVARVLAWLVAVATPAVIRSISALVNILAPPEFCRLAVSQPATIAVDKTITLNLKDCTVVPDSPFRVAIQCGVVLPLYHILGSTYVEIQNGEFLVVPC